MKIRKICQDDFEIEENNSFASIEEITDEYGSYDIPPNELLKIINEKNLPVKHLAKSIFSTEENNKQYVFQTEKDWIEYIEDVCEWISGKTTGDILEILDLNEDQIHIGGIGSTMENVKKSPGKVYHFTTEDAIKEIKESGVLKGSYGTGIENRHAFGIFATIDKEEYASGTYGNVLIEINLENFMKENNIESLDIEVEPEILEHEVREILAYKMNVECVFDSPSDISPLTLIIRHEIPMKYLTII